MPVRELSYNGSQEAALSNSSKWGEEKASGERAGENHCSKPTAPLGLGFVIQVKVNATGVSVRGRTPHPGIPRARSWAAVSLAWH